MPPCRRRRPFPFFFSVTGSHLPMNALQETFSLLYQTYCCMDYLPPRVRCHAFLPIPNLSGGAFGFCFLSLLTVHSSVCTCKCEYTCTHFPFLRFDPVPELCHGNFLGSLWVRGKQLIPPRLYVVLRKHT